LTTQSDKRLKTNINDLSINCINLLNKIKSVEFNWIDNYRIPEKKRHTLDHGFIAQYVEEILPNLVNSEGEYKSLKYEKFAPYIIKAIQELTVLINDQQNQINLIKSHLNL
jgi:1,2-phenylacetyl-CoA epoxidase catalytic subunit